MYGIPYACSAFKVGQVGTYSYFRVEMVEEGGSLRRSVREPTPTQSRGQYTHPERKKHQ